MGGIVAVDARQQHRKVGDFLVVGIRDSLDILVGLRFGGLYHLVVGHLRVGIGIALLVAQIFVDQAGDRHAGLVDPHQIVHLTVILAADHIEFLGKDGAAEQRPLAILLAVKIRTEREYIVGRVLVHRRAGVGADEQQRIRRIAHEDQENGQHDNVEHPDGNLRAGEEHIAEQGGRQEQADPYVADERHARKHQAQAEAPLDGLGVRLAVKRAYSPYEHSHQQDGIDEDAHVVRHAEDIDKQQFEPLGHHHESGHETVEDQSHDRERHQQGDQRPLGRHILAFLVIVDEHDGRDAQQIEQVHGDGHADHIGDKYQVSVAMGLVGAVLPLEYEPEHQRRTERREGVDLALDGREPERVAPRVGQRAAKAAGEDQRHLPPGHGRGIVGHYQPPDQMSHGPEQQQDGRRRQQGRHRVDGNGRIGYVVAENGHEEARREHEYRVARRVSHLQLGALRYELGAVPEARGRLQGQQIGHGGYHERYPAEDVVQ